MIRIIASKLIPFLKYWRAGVMAALAIGFMVSFHFAQSRGERLDEANHTIEQERQKFQSQIQAMEKARQDDNERNDFRKTQARKFRLADDASLRSAYDGLRRRQAANAHAR